MAPAMLRRTLKILFSTIVAILLAGLALREWDLRSGHTPTKGTSHFREMPGPPHGPTNTVTIPPSTAQTIGVRTVRVAYRDLVRTLRVAGLVAYDEKKVSQINLRVAGWITRLDINYTDQFVQKNDPLFSLYSPDLVSTEEEYLLALKTARHVKLPIVLASIRQQIDASRRRMLRWGLTEEQIRKIAEKGRAEREIPILSPVTGMAVRKNVFKGVYVTPNRTLYEIADLSKVWILASVYEYQIPFVREGQTAAVTLPSFPGKTFEGRIVYVPPVLNTATRTVQVRLEFENPDLSLRPGMYGDVTIRIPEKHILSVPRDAVLDSGVRKTVFRVLGPGRYQPTIIEAGPRIGKYIPVYSGLLEGEEVVSSGTFLIDSESRLSAAENQMGGMNMGNGKAPSPGK